MRQGQLLKWYACGGIWEDLPGDETELSLPELNSILQVAFHCKRHKPNSNQFNTNQGFYQTFPVGTAGFKGLNRILRSLSLKSPCFCLASVSEAPPRRQRDDPRQSPFHRFRAGREHPLPSLSQNFWALISLVCPPLIMLPGPEICKLSNPPSRSPGGGPDPR